MADLPPLPPKWSAPLTEVEVRPLAGRLHGDGELRALLDSVLGSTALADAAMDVVSTVVGPRLAALEAAVQDGDGRLAECLDKGLCLHCMKPVGVPWVRCIGFPEHPDCHERECR